jgi:D-alanyl-D-alanine carboxypeptidase
MVELRLRAAVEDLLREEETPGAAVALTIDGRPVLQAGVGFRDLDGTVPLERDPPCYIYSVTKLLLANAALQLVEQQRLRLDAPVLTYLPQLPLTAGVTVRRLLNHTGGLPDYGELPEYRAALRADPTRPWTTGEFLERTLAGGLLFEPGAGWAYSNIGYLIVRLLLESIQGVPLRDILQHAIFDPLALQRTFVADDLSSARALTPGFSSALRDDGALEDIAPHFHPGWVSHGVVISTPTELAAIVEALFTSELLDESSLATMLEPVPVAVEHSFLSQPAYGLGLMLDAASPHGIVAGHGGIGPGYSIGALYLSHVAGRRVTSVVFANRDRGDLGLRIAYRLARLVADAEHQ